MIVASIVIAGLIMFSFSYFGMKKLKKEYERLKDDCPDGGVRREVVHIWKELKVQIKVDKSVVPMRTTFSFNHRYFD